MADAYAPPRQDRSNTIDWQKLKRMLDSAYATSPVSAAPLTFSGNLCRYLLRAFSNSHHPLRAIATEGGAWRGGAQCRFGPS